MTRAGNRGEIVEIEAGRKYLIRASVGSGSARRRPQRTVEGNLSAARKALTRLLAEIDDATLLSPTRLTVTRLLAEHADAHKSSWSPKHYQESRAIARNYIDPHIGHIRASDLTPRHVRDWLRKLEERKSSRSGESLRPSTRNAAYRVAHAAFEEAVRLEMITRNPFRAVAPPKIPPTPVQAWSAVQLLAIEQAATGRSIYIPVVLAIRTGMRRGELLALKWEDVNLSDSGSYIDVRYALSDITGGIIRKATKTERPRRVQIDAHLRDVLRAWRTQQAAVMRSEYLLRAGKSQWVCSHDDGTLILPNYLTREFGKLLTETGLAGPGLSFKSLRAAHETLLAEAGFDRYQLGRRLGHSPRVAERHYIGDLPETDRRAAAAFGEILEKSGSIVEVFASDESARKEAER